MEDAVDRPSGLSSVAAERLRERYGPNALPEQRGPSPWALFARQFRSVLVLILVAAAGLALLLGEALDAIAIALVVLLNAILGFIQEWRAETAIDALRSMLAPMARAVRDGREQMIAATELVPGDLVILEAGDHVPADLALTGAVRLKIDESALTGESAPVEKSVDSETGVQAFMGTSVAGGRGEGIVTATGAQSAFGRIATLTGSVDRRPTVLQLELGRLARQLGVAAIAIAGAVALVGVSVGRPTLEMVMTGLSLAVAIVPEGLPAVVTITLALGASAMVRQNALARRLQAVETLGAASVICTDKTGTLTENEMTATRVWTAAGACNVTGTGYDPAGHLETAAGSIRAVDEPLLGALLETAAVCNHAKIARVDGRWTLTGDPTEGALVVLAMKGWLEVPEAPQIIAENPFDSARKRMSMLVDGPHGPVLHVKGAPEQVVEASDSLVGPEGVQPLGLASRRLIRNAYEDMAAQGLRVVAVARRGGQAETSMAEEQTR